MNNHHRIAISFGGTKTAIGIFNSITHSLIAESERIEWKNHPKYSPSAPLDTLLEIIVLETAQLFKTANIDPITIEGIGIGWPGPGDYTQGLLRATFIPGCENEIDLFSLLNNTFTSNGFSFKHDMYFSGLDVNNRTFGELDDCESVLNTVARTARNGLVINIATGIAGALIQQRKIVSTAGLSRQNYGQWGRYLFYNNKKNVWRFSETIDGSIPNYDRTTEKRFTELCGGPGIVNTVIAEYKEHDIFRNAILSYITDDFRCRIDSYTANSRNIVLEKLLLKTLSRGFNDFNNAVVSFVDEIASLMSGALLSISKQYIIDESPEVIVLTGGVGELFCFPDKDKDDLFIKKIEHLSGFKAGTVVRSKGGLQTELLGCAGICSPAWIESVTIE